MTIFRASGKWFAWEFETSLKKRYTGCDSKDKAADTYKRAGEQSELAQRAAQFFVWSERPLYKHKARDSVSAMIAEKRTNCLARV